MSFYTPNLSFSVIYALCIGVKAYICEISRNACKNRSGRAYARNTYVKEHCRDQKVCVKPDFSTLPGQDVCIGLPCPTFKCASERQTKCDRGIFCWLVVLKVQD